MKYDRPLVRGTLIKRYKRFLADVVLDSGEEITVHCANSGSMKTCAEPGRPVILSDAQNPKRKLQYTWEMIRMGRTWVGVHSAYANRIVEKGIEHNKVAQLTGYDTLRREVAYGEGKRSRIDLLLESHNRPPCYVEVKFSTMRVGNAAAFPDAVTTRGRKHLVDLQRVVQLGHRGVIFFAVGRNDCTSWHPADDIDPEYGQTLREAVANGVAILAYGFQFSPRGVQWTRRLPVVL